MQKQFYIFIFYKFYTLKYKKFGFVKQKYKLKINSYKIKTKVIY